MDCMFVFTVNCIIYFLSENFHAIKLHHRHHIIRLIWVGGGGEIHRKTLSFALLDPIPSRYEHQKHQSAAQFICVIICSS